MQEVKGDSALPLQIEREYSPIVVDTVLSRVDDEGSISLNYDGEELSELLTPGNSVDFLRFKPKASNEDLTEEPHPDLERCERALPLKPTPEEYLSHALPTIHKGDPNHTPLLFYGGLAGTGYNRKKLGEQLHQDHDTTVSIRSLAGHQGCYEELATVTHEDWVNDIILNAERLTKDGKPIVFFGYSTSALAAVEAVSKRPDLFAGLVLVGPPFELRSPLRKTLLNVLEKVDSWIPGTRKLFEKLSFSMGSRDPDAGYTGLAADSPRASEVPFSTLVEVHRIQRSARKSISDVECPVLVIQGGLDRFADTKSTAKHFVKLGSEDKELVIYEDSPHPVMLGEDMEKFEGRVKQWLQKLDIEGEIELGESQDPDPVSERIDLFTKWFRRSAA